MPLPAQINPGTRADALDGDEDFDAWTKVVANFAYLLTRADSVDATTSAGIATLAAAVAAKASLDSPVFTGTPKVPTATAGATGAQAASLDFVRVAITALVNSSPATLDTLKELADAIGDDPNFATTIATQLGLKAPLDSPTFTGQPKAPTPPTGDLSGRLATTAFAAAAGAAGQVTGFLPSAFQSGSSVTVSAGAAADSTNAALISGGPFSWAASNGNAANGFQGGTSLPANSTIHFFAMRGAAGVASFASASLSPTLPSGYTLFRRVFSLRTDGSGALIGGKPVEIGGGAVTYWLTTPTLDFGGGVGVSARTMIPLNVPAGIKVQPLYRMNASTSNNPASVIITSGDETDLAPPGGNAAWTTAPGSDIDLTSAAMNVAGSSAQLGMLTTDTSGQIGLRAFSGQVPNVYWVTRGFVDFRRG